MKLLKNKQILFSVILLSAIIVRFWKLEQLFHWTLDEEFWSYLPHNIATGYHFPLIGGHIGGTGVYSGPLFVWLMGIIFFIARSNPLGIAFFVSSMGVSTVLLLYLGLKAYLKSRVALVASGLYAVSTLATLYDRKYWNASLSSFLGVLSLWLIYRIKQKPETKLIIVLGVVSSLAVNAHMTGFVVVCFSLICLYLYKIGSRKIFLYLATLIVCHLPLVAFDLRHDFLNTKALIQLATDTKESQTVVPASPNPFRLTYQTFSRLIYTPATDIKDELTLCVQAANSRSVPNLVYQGLALLGLLFGFYLLLKKDPSAVLLFTNIGLVIIYALFSPETFYPGMLSEYYFLPAFGAFMVVLAKMLDFVPDNLSHLSGTILLFILVINMQTTLNLTHSYNYSQKLEVVTNAISQVGDRNFSLDVQGEECQQYGYRYLFTWLKHEPNSSYLDSSMSWLYQKRLPHGKPEVEILIKADSATIEINEIN